MRYNIIRKMDISNGKGVRVSVFMQGCEFHCPGCFNPETHDFDGGEQFTDEIIEKVMTLCSKEWVEGLSILGGEPLHPRNIEGTTKLAKRFKELYPEKNLWVWTGFLYEVKKDEEVMKYIDVLVDGVFKQELHDFRLRWKGSSNQRVIDIPKTRQSDTIVLYTE